MLRSHALRRCALAGAILITTGCGYIGAPLVPLANVPQKITDLAAVQRGAVLIVHCSLPVRTTENVLIKSPLVLDMRIGTASDHFNAAEWAGQAKPIENPEFKDGLATYQIPSKDWAGKEVVIGVRATGPNGKPSDWSNFQIVSVVAPPATPSSPALQGTAAGVQVTWTGPGDQFRVLRAGSDGNFAVTATVSAHEWTDPNIEYGKPYQYEVQALVNLGNQKVAESDLSASSGEKTFEDEFPPAIPTGLRADATPGSISLVWEADTEADLAGYRVYRAEGGGPWQKLADVDAVPAYTDATAEHGKAYRYAVTAFDKTAPKANESERCAPVEIAFQ